MKPLASSHPSSPRSFFRPALLASCLQALLAAPGLHAATYYWDNNGSTSGFGTAAGTWAAPTTNNSTQGWSTSSAGTNTLSGTTTTTTSDALNFGTSTDGLATGSITVTGNLNAGSITFGAASGNITLTTANQTITLGTGGVITVDSSYATIVHKIAGSNGLTKNGTGTLVVPMTSTYSGNTTVNSGTLRLENLATNGGADLASTPGSNFFINNGSKLVMHTNPGGNNRSISNNDLFTFDSNGGGTLEWSGGNILMQGGQTHRFVTNGGSQNVMTTTNGGYLNGQTAGIAEFNVADGSDAVDLLASTSFNNILITKNGTGTMSITTSSSGSYAVTVNEGVLDIGGSATLAGGTFSATLTTNATFSYSSSATQTISAAVVGTGGVTVNGTGTLKLAAANTYSGSTTLTAGTLQLGNAGTTGALSTSSSISTGSGGVLSINRTNTVTQGTDFSGSAITGAGGFLQNGSGTTILNATNTYNGSTTINAGTLQIDGNIANSGLVINSGGTISPGTTAAADSFGTSSITINGGGYNWTLNTANGSAGSGWDQITSTGALTSSGLLTVYAYGTPGDWNGANSYSWDIISANSVSGFSAGNFALDLTNFGIAAGNRTGTWSFSNPSGGIIRLSYTASGDPVWTGGTANWDTGFSPAVTEGDTIAFSGAGGTATNNISNGTLTTVNDIEFRNGAGAYTLAANAGSAGASGGMALTVNGSIINNSLNTQTINMEVAPGSIVINTGALEIGAAGRLNSGSYSNTISNSVSLIYSGTNAQTLSGDISGTGALTKNASSTLTLTGNNTYSGATTINAGTLEIGGTGRLGGGSYAGNIVMTGAFTYNSTADQTLSGQISGAGAFNKFASSTLTLSGSNTRSGTLTMGVNVGNLTAGTVKLGHSNALGTGSNVWENDGTLELAANGLTVANANNIYARASATDGKRRYRLDLAGSNTGTFSGNFDIRMPGLVFDVGTDDTLTASGSLTNGAGGGGFEKTGTGTLVLTGATNTLNSNIVISAGTLQIGNGGTTGTLNSLAVTNNGSLVFNRSNAITVANAISGTGSLIKNGSNTLTLTGSNTYSGGTTLNTGTLVIGNAAAAGTGTITQTDGTSVLKLDTTGTIANAMSIYNVVSNQTVTLSGAITAQNTTYDVATGTTLSINGAIGGTGGVTKEGNGTLELNAANTFTGDTVVNFGTLEANATGSLASTGNITVNGGSLLVGANNAINNSAAMDLAGGTLEFGGSITETIGALTLSANSVIDMGGGNIALEFSNLVTQLTSTTQLKIYNYTLYSDHLYFTSNANVSDSLQYISFYSGFGTGFIGNSFISSFSSPWQVQPVPEPETWTTAALLLIGGGVWMWRKRRIRI